MQRGGLGETARAVLLGSFRMFLDHPKRAYQGAILLSRYGAKSNMRSFESASKKKQIMVEKKK